MTQVIDSFSGEYRFLSNFFIAPVPLDGANYLSVEHAYQAAKSPDYEYRRKIMLTPSHGQVKRIGKHVQLRDDWESVKLKIMEDLVYLKFTRHESIKQRLIHTHDATLIEGNNWGDTFWGVCNGIGENHLGNILMEVRHHLQGSLWPNSTKKLNKGDQIKPS